eukprot:3973009-Alexandrium_andersonii.AAC.1
MSASLVGSEMCIRDRDEPLPISRYPRSPPHRGSFWGPRIAVAKGAGAPCCLLYTSDAADDM